MKICVISPGVIHAVPRTLAFSRYFNDVHFIDTAGNADRGTLEAAGIHYYRPEHHRLSRIPFLNLLKLLKSIGPDVIVCHFCAGGHFFGAIAYGRCPVAGIVMGSDVLYDRGDRKVSMLRRLLIRMGLRRTLYISAKSDYLRQRIRHLGASCPVTVNYWGADMQQFKPTDRTEARKKLGLPESAPIIISPRTLSRLYSIDAIIDAMSLVVRTEPQALLVVFGIEVSKYRDELEQQIITAGLQGNIQMIGVVKFDDVPDYYNAGDIVVSMAKTEGFPNSVLEVMCCRRPVLVGRLPQIEEILQNNLHCRMVEINSHDIAQSIVELIQNPRQAAKLAEGGHRVAHEFADIRKNGKIFASDLKQHLSAHRRVSQIKLMAYRLILLIYTIQRRLLRE